MHHSKMNVKFLLSGDPDATRPPTSGSSSGPRRQTSTAHNSSSSHAASSTSHRTIQSSSSSASTSAAASARVKSHKCFCGRAFNKREHLKRHKLLVHEEQRPYECTTCDLRFGTKQNMQVHLTTRKHKQRVTFLAPRGQQPM